MLTLEAQRSRSNCMFRLFDDRLPVEPKWPSVKPSEADFALADDVHEPVQWNEELNCKRNDNDLAKLLHAPPG